jgi:single-strand DNA-binding protein
VSVNRVILIGRLETDPERRSLNNGTPVVNLILVTTESWRDKHSGERRRREERHRVTIFNEALGRIATEYLRKGAEIYLCGTLRTRKWVDGAGVQHDTSEVVLPIYGAELQMLDRRDGGDR